MGEQINAALEKATPDLKKIRIALGWAEVLAQLAEEAAALAQAALTLRRAFDGANPTPVSYEAAERALQGEFADVLLCMSAVGVVDSQVVSTIYYKTARWRARLDEKEEGHD